VSDIYRLLSITVYREFNKLDAAVEVCVLRRYVMNTNSMDICHFFPNPKSNGFQVVFLTNADWKRPLFLLL